MRVYFTCLVAIFLYTFHMANAEVLKFSTLYPSSCSDCTTLTKSIFDSKQSLYFDSISHDVTLALEAFDSKEDSGTALEQSQMIIQKQSSFISAGSNSAITMMYSPYFSHKGYPHLGISSWPTLSDREKYPMHFSVSVPTRQCAALVPEFLQQMDWNRFALLGSDTPYSTFYVEGIITRTKELKMKLVDSEIFPYRVSLQSNGREIIRSVLDRMMKLQIYAFVTVVHQIDIPLLFDVAHELGIFGQKEYSWIGGSSSIVKFKREDIPFAKNHPEKLQGLFGIYRGCDELESNPAFQELKSNTRSQTPSVTSCYAQDAVVGTLMAANETIAFMKKHSIPKRCLETDFFTSNQDFCASAATNDLILSELSKLGLDCSQYDTSSKTICKFCGICEVIERRKVGNVQEGQAINYIQLLQAAHIYSLNFQGASGWVSLDSQTGGRTMEGLSYYVYNWRGNDTFTKIGQLNTNIDNSSDKDVFDLTVDEQFRPIYSGGSLEVPNFVRNNVYPSEQIIETPKAFRIVWMVIFILSVCGCLLALAFFFYKRKELVIKTSSIPLMTLIMLGVITMLFVILVLNVEPYLNDDVCMSSQWLQHVGFFLVFPPVLIKTFRIKHIFDRLKKSRKASPGFSDNRLIIYIFLGVAAVCTYLTVWTIVHPSQAEATIKEEVLGNQITQYCSRSWWEYGLLIVELLLVLYAVVLSYSTKDVPSYFKESKLVCFVVFNWIIIFVFAEIIFLINDNALLFITVRCVMMLLLSIVIVSSLFGFKFYLIAVGQGSNADGVALSDSAKIDGGMTSSSSNEAMKGRRKCSTQGTSSASLQKPRNNSIVV